MKFNSALPLVHIYLYGLLPILAPLQFPFQLVQLLLQRGVPGLQRLAPSRPALLLLLHALTAQLELVQVLLLLPPALLG